MQTNHSRSNRDGSSAPKRIPNISGRGRTRIASHSAKRPASPAVILAPSSPFPTPSLTEIQYCYRKAANLAPMCEIAAQGVEAGIGSRELWELSRHNPSEFLELSLAQHLEARKIKTISNCIDLAMGITKSYEDDDSQYSLWLAVTGCCSLVVGDTIKRLEQISPKLAVAWYRILSSALSCAGYVYDAKDAYQQFEYMVENSDMYSSQEENEQYLNELEKMNPDNDIPPCVLETLKKMWSRREIIADVATVKIYRNKSIADVLDPVLEMWRISQVPSFKRLKEESEDNDGTQLPFCAIFFNEHDSIHAAFDEFGQHVFQGDIDETIWSRNLSTKDSTAFLKAVPSLNVYLGFLEAMAALHAAIESKSPR